MKKFLLKIIFLLLALMLLTSKSQSQKIDCNKRYNEALKLYEQKKLDSALAMLKPCLKTHEVLLHSSPKTLSDMHQLAAKIIFRLNNWSANESYKAAQEQYKNGRIDSALIALYPVINEKKEMKRVSKETKADIYRLAAHCFYIIENPAQAEENIKKMLAYQPYYLNESSNDDDLIRFANKVELLTPYALPQFMLGARGGTNFTRVKQLNKFSVSEMEHYNTNKKYTKSFGVQFGITGQFFISLHKAVAFEINLISHKLTYENTITPKNQIESFQKFSYWEFPLVGKYYFRPLKPWKPYLEAGGFYKIMMNATKDNNYDLTTVTTTCDYGYLVGTGVVYKNSKSTFSFNIRYLHGLRNIANPDRRYTTELDNNSLVFEFYDVIDDIKFRNLQISFGWMYHLNYKVFK